MHFGFENLVQTAPEFQKWGISVPIKNIVFLFQKVGMK